MRQTLLPPALLSSLLTVLPTWSQAHEGHGLSGAHWHITDIMGFVVAAALVAALFWFSRK